MGLEVKSIKDAIEARLETIPGITVYQDEVPGTVTLPTTTSGAIRPYVILYFSEPFRSADGRGIVSSRHDTNVFLATAQVNAPDSTSANSIIDQVRDKLTGWSTTNTGEFFLRGGASRSKSSTSVAPATYIREAVFETRCNLSFN